MRLSDKYAYQWIKTITRDGQAVIIYSDMAVEIGCHRHTARRICKSLTAAGLIKHLGGSDKAGQIYELVPNE
jgi:DNA-binding transcriptional regulator YhcF (GntR family)